MIRQNKTVTRLDAAVLPHGKNGIVLNFKRRSNDVKNCNNHTKARFMRT